MEFIIRAVLGPGSGSTLTQPHHSDNLWLSSGLNEIMAGTIVTPNLVAGIRGPLLMLKFCFFIVNSF